MTIKRASRLLLPIVLVSAAVLLIRETRNSCTDTFATDVMSPDGRWRAKVIESLCEAPLVSDITAGLYVAATADPDEVAEILSVDTGGHNDERPRIAWTAPNVLRVTVPNLSYLNVLKRDFDGVHIDLRYDPDDPAARAAWRRHLGEPPDADAPR